jgi:hypothetical protein
VAAAAVVLVGFSIGESVKVLFFWEAAGLSLEKANPYAGLLGRAMTGLGVEFERDLLANWRRSF